MIDIEAFGHCYSLTNITIPNSVTQIGNSSFQNCYSLANIAIPNGVTSIGSSAFQACYSLSSITIPNTLTSISANTFNSNSSITKYDFSSYNEIPSLANVSAFANINSNCKIIVPDSLYEDWIVATNWSTYASYIIKKTDWEAL